MSDLPSPVINTAEVCDSPSLGRSLEFSPLTRLDPIGRPALVKVELRGANVNKSYDDRNLDAIADKLRDEIEHGLLTLGKSGKQLQEAMLRAYNEAQQQ